MRVIKLVAKRNKCAKYFELGKHGSLPLLEEAIQGATHTTDKDTDVNKHGLAVHILTVAFQNEVKLLSYIMETEIAAWPTEEMHKVMLKIEKHYKITTNIGNKLKHEIAKEELSDAINNAVGL